MPINRNALLRYNTLDKCFSNFGRKYSFDDLLEEVNNALSDSDPSTSGIKTRQLREDIKFMRSEAGFSAPIETIKDNGDYYYRYDDKSFSINKSPISSSEAEILKSAVSLLKRFEGAPQFEWLNEISPMLSNQFGLVDSNKKVISYDANIDYTAHDKIPTIFNAIINGRVLEIEYEPFDKPPFTLNFHPYFLKQYNNRWFAFGLNEMLKIPTWNLALDRIKKIKEVDEKYIHVAINWEEYFDDIIGVSKPIDKNPEDIVLIFSESQANYIKTKPLHMSQVDKILESGELQVKLNLIPNYELEMTILGFGETAKVLSPESLKGRILKRIKSAYSNY